jgi:hypothetical protein
MSLAPGKTLRVEYEQKEFGGIGRLNEGEPFGHNRNF